MPLLLFQCHSVWLRLPLQLRCNPASPPSNCCTATAGSPQLYLLMVGRLRSLVDVAMGSRVSRVVVDHPGDPPSASGRHRGSGWLGANSGPSHPLCQRMLPSYPSRHRSEPSSDSHRACSLLYRIELTLFTLVRVIFIKDQLFLLHCS